MGNSNDVLELVRRANPVAAEPIHDAELRARIVASPGDERLVCPPGAGKRPRRRRRRARATGLGLAGVLVVSGGAAFAAGVNPFAFSPEQLPSSPQLPYDSAQTLFSAGKVAVASSVTELGTVTVPGVGQLQYWGARTAGGGYCEAFKLPDGTWAGTDSAIDGADAEGPIKPHYDFGGLEPGCDIFGPEVHGGGFYWDEDTFGPIVVNNTTQVQGTHVIYGYVDTPGQPVTVRDATTGISSPVFDGHWFALVVPPTLPTFNLKLESLDAAGNVISQASPNYHLPLRTSPGGPVRWITGPPIMVNQRYATTP